MNALVTAVPGLVPIFVSAGGVNALAGVLLQNDIEWEDKSIFNSSILTERGARIPLKTLNDQ